jgi:hypothetical protein
VQAAYLELATALAKVGESLERSGIGRGGFARSDRLGYLTSCPSNLGTALRIAVVVRLPLLLSDADAGGEGGVTEWLARRRLACRGGIDEGGQQLQGVLEVSNRDRFGFSEVDVVNSVVEAVGELVRAEQRLEEGLPALLGSSQSAAVVEEVVPPPPPPLPIASQPPQQPPETVAIDDLEDVRTKMRSVLEESYRSGSLKAVLGGLESDVSNTQDRAIGMLETSYADGSLSEVLQATGRDNVELDAATVELARLELRET